LHKKGDPACPDNYRGISLLSVCGKVYVGVLHNRLRQHLCSQLLPTQFGFVPGKGTAGALFTLRRLLEVRRAHGAALYAAFLDLSKAFDSVHRDTLWQLLLARGVHPKLVALIKDLYDGSTFQVTTSTATSEPRPMNTGVRQGCPMSPTLFNVFIDFLARLILSECVAAGIPGVTVGFHIDGHLTTPPSTSPNTQLLTTLMLLYADDIVLLTESETQLQQALTIAERVFQQWGMQLSHIKTQAMCLCPGSTHQPPAQQPQQIQLHQGSVQVVDKFKYLGSLLQPQGHLESELSRRIALAAASFTQLRQYLCDQSLSMHTRILAYKAVVVPTLLYGAAESWALSASQLQRLDTFNTSCLRRMAGFTRLDHVTNEHLHSITEQPPISSLLRCHRLRWLGHVARQKTREPTMQILFAHSVPGYGRPRSGRNTTWLRCAYQDVQELGMPGTVWFDTAQDRERWAEKIEIK
jgi:hypothetical protein